ncbi:MAG: hypothetical protein ACLPKB_02485 [Xanthobacteraceae bacterium]
MSAISSIAAISAATSSRRLGVFPYNVASGSASGLLSTQSESTTAPAATAAPAAAPAPNQPSNANAQGPGRANQVDATGAPLGTVPVSAAAGPTANVVTTFDPRSPYGLTHGTPPTADLASQMVQQLVAFYPFPINGPGDTAQTIDLKT